MANIPLRPLDDRVVAIREEAATKTTSGLYLPAEHKEKSQIAKVVAVGSNVHEVKVDDRRRRYSSNCRIVTKGGKNGKTSFLW